MLNTLFCCTADSMQSLSQKLDRILHHISQGVIKDINACNLLFPLNDSDPIRLSTAINDLDIFTQELQKIQSKIKRNEIPKSNPTTHVFISYEPIRQGKAIFMFPGFGSEFATMFSGLFDKFPIIAHWKTFIEKFLKEKGPTQSHSAWEKWLETKIKSQKFGLAERGPLGSVFSLAIYQILESLGISCDAMIGHSNGENSALIASNILKYKTNDDLLRILQTAVNISKDYSNPGQYISVSNINQEAKDKYLQKFKSNLCMAMDNCPNQQIYYIANTYKKEFLKALYHEKAIAFEIPTDHPFHTPAFKTNAEYITKIYTDFEITTGKIPVYSCVDGTLFPNKKEEIIAYASKQWTAPVLFNQTIQQAYQDGFTSFIEIGPNGKLAGFCRDILRGKAANIMTASTGRIPSLDAITRLCAQLWVTHHNIRIEKLLPKRPYTQPKTSNKLRSAIFSEYQYMMQEFLAVQNRTAELFFKTQSISKKSDAIPFETTLLKGTCRKTFNGIKLQTKLSLDKHPLVKDHAMGGVLAVVPFTVSLEIAAEAASVLASKNNKECKIINARAFGWLDFQHHDIPLLISVNNTTNEKIHDVKIYRQSSTQSDSNLVFQAEVAFYSTSKNSQKPLSLGTLNPPTVTVDHFYEHHLFHGTCFKSIHTIEGWNNEGVVSHFIMPDVSQALAKTTTPDFLIPGPMLDGTGQLMAYWMLEQHEKSYAIFPFEIEEFIQYNAFPKPGTVVYCQAKIKRNTAVITGNFEFFMKDGTPLASMKNFKLRIFKHPLVAPLLMNRLSKESIQKLNSAFLNEGGHIWTKILGKLTYTNQEYNAWLTKPAQEQIKQLITHYHGYDALVEETV